ncbi:DUF6541 family protein [Adlercreutzia caecimuris]|uniref:DUF6541 family protein n=1 Tax=Adlercreutzia caecimuris TaxID=671266 RepID=UPI002494036C|nr:DUF6541 family protein [Adlercreutzia caecimuris]
MWFTFALCMLAGLLALYVPGMAASRALGLRGALAIACAPLASVALISLLCIAYGVIGIPCNGASVLAPVVLVSIAGLLASHILRSQGRSRWSLPERAGRSSSAFDFGSLALYIVAGLAVCVYVYIKSLDGPESFYARHDNITHLNLVRSYLDSGIWSTLQTSNYLAAPDYAVSRTGGSFYPAAWHGLAALICSLTNCSVPMGVNALNAVLAGIAYPASMWVLVQALFPENRGVILWGAIATMAFTAFPWAFFTKGPLYSNLLAFALVPAPLGIIIASVRQGGPLRKALLPLGALGLLSFVSLALAQPNALFTVFVFLACFGGKCLWERGRKAGWPRKSALLLVAYTCGVIVLWAILFKLPFLQAVIWYEWPKNVTFTNGLFKLLTLSFTASVPQALLVTMVVVGAVACVAKRHSWLLLSPAFFAGTYLLSATTNGLLKHLLCGFWYTDPVRLAACATMFLVPVAAYGLWTVARCASTLLSQAIQAGNGRRCAAAVSAGLAIVFCLCNFFPSYHMPGQPKEDTTDTPFGRVKYRLSGFYAMDDEKVYDAAEQAFVRKVLEAIPEGALVLNQPNDGSVFAYGLDNLNTYYRQISHEGETENARLIREHLSDIVSDPAVQKAAKETGARYVLLLDQGVSRKKGTWLAQYKDPKSWRGIDSITDDTPGFKPILSNGEMRLYEIE